MAMPFGRGIWPKNVCSSSTKIEQEHALVSLSLSFHAGQFSHKRNEAQGSLLNILSLLEEGSSLRSPDVLVLYNIQY